MRLYCYAAAFIKVVRRFVETCRWRVSSATHAMPQAVGWLGSYRLTGDVPLARLYIQCAAFFCNLTVWCRDA